MSCRRVVYSLLLAALPCFAGCHGLLVSQCAAGQIADATALADEQPVAPGPNIVLMMADDLGWGDPGFNGGETAKTPHLDRMARGGLRFERFYAAAPVCSPTRGSCLTGRHPYRYGVLFANTGHMRQQELTLAELLGAHGYATGHFGKWHLGTMSKDVVESNRGGPRGAAHFAPPWLNGFDVCFSTEAKVPTFDPMLRPREAKGAWWDPVDDPSEAEPYGTHYWSAGKQITENLRGDDSRVIMDRAVEFVEAAVDDQQPFFAVVWFHAPHLPVVAGPEHTALYPDQSKYAQHYFGCITALDEQVGRLVDTLRRRETLENTMIWFCSDNGPEGRAGSAPGSAGPLRGRKRDLFEGGVRVPGLLHWPARIAAGRETAVPACTSDILPTIAQLVGAEPLDRRPIDGVNLLPLVDGRMTARPRPIAFESRGKTALIDNRYKILGKSPRGKQSAASPTAPQFVLFDLEADPGEQNDVAAEHPQVVAQMAAILARWRTSCRESLDGKDYPSAEDPKP